MTELHLNHVKKIEIESEENLIDICKTVKINFYTKNYSSEENIKDLTLILHVNKNDLKIINNYIENKDK